MPAKWNVDEWNGDAISADYDQAARRGLEATAADMVAPAQARTPRVTGTAQGSVRFEPAVKRGSKWVVLFGSFNVAYYIWLEIGARGRAGGRMLQSAMDEHWGELVANIKRFAKG
jgi:hypothetical protein